MNWDMIINVGMFALGCSFIIVATAILIFKDFDDEKGQEPSQGSDGVDEDVPNYGKSGNPDEWHADKPSIWYMDLDMPDTGDLEVDMIIATGHVMACCDVKQKELDCSNE